jgi:hypothetical protein
MQPPKPGAASGLATRGSLADEGVRPTRVEEILESRGSAQSSRYFQTLSSAHFCVAHPYLPAGLEYLHHYFIHSLERSAARVQRLNPVPQRKPASALPDDPLVPANLHEPHPAAGVAQQQIPAR